MQAAKDRGAKSIAFPNISTGLFFFPKRLASKLTMLAVRHLLDESFDFQFERVVFLVWSPNGVSPDLEHYDANFK